MGLLIQKLAAAQAAEIARDWQYVDEAIGTGDLQEAASSPAVPARDYFQVLRGQKLVGYFIVQTLDAGARVELELNLAPSLVGQGQGHEFVTAVLAAVVGKWPAATILLAVPAANLRAQHIFQQLGFHYEALEQRQRAGRTVDVLTMTRPGSRLPILDYDPDPDAVLPPFRDEGFHFPKKLLYAFITEENINLFLAKYPHEKIGNFATVSHIFDIYQVTIGGEQIGVCQAVLGAPAATQLLDFLIAYGAEQIIAVGSCGVLTALPEGYLLVPTIALRDEGTSYHYLPAASTVATDPALTAALCQFLTQEQRAFTTVKTWTTDGFFRETVKRVTAIREAGFTVVEMECAALAACAQFRQVQFTQLLFSGDSLADVTAHDERGMGMAAHAVVLELGLHYLASLPTATAE